MNRFVSANKEPEPEIEFLQKVFSRDLKVVLEVVQKTADDGHLSIIITDTITSCRRSIPLKVYLEPLDALHGFIEILREFRDRRTPHNRYIPACVCERCQRVVNPGTNEEGVFYCPHCKEVVGYFEEDPYLEKPKWVKPEKWGEGV